MKNFTKKLTLTIIWSSHLTFNTLSYTNTQLSLIPLKNHNLPYKNSLLFSTNNNGEYERRLQEINDINNNRGSSNAGSMKEQRQVPPQERAFQQYENGRFYWNRFNNDKLPEDNQHLSNPYRYGDQKYNLNSQKATDSRSNFDYGTPHGRKNVAKARSRLYEDFMDRDLAQRRDMGYPVCV